MPGAGKSTVGVVLAKHLSYDFVDTDLLIQVTSQRNLQEIIDTDGYLVLRQLEEDVLLELSVENHVISTGGSAVYSDAGMIHLKSAAHCIFLNAELATLEARIHDFPTRGIAKKAEQSFAEVFEERRVLYSRYADIVIECDELNVEQVCEKVEDAIELFNK
jgi:shikimate kinase